MTNDLAELKRLYAAATPGEWEWSERVVHDDGHVYIPQGSHLGETLIALDNSYEHSAEDCDFIAAIHNAFPAMCAEIERLRAALENLMDWQHGPPLIRSAKGWNKAMEQANKALEGKP